MGVYSSCASTNMCISACVFERCALRSSFSILLHLHFTQLQSHRSTDGGVLVHWGNLSLPDDAKSVYEYVHCRTLKNESVRILMTPAASSAED